MRGRLAYATAFLIEGRHYDLAAVLLTVATEMAERNFGPESEVMCRTLSHAASRSDQMGRWEDAERYARRAVSL